MKIDSITLIQTKFDSNTGGRMNFTRGNFKPKSAKLDSARSILPILSVAIE